MVVSSISLTAKSLSKVDKKYVTIGIHAVLFSAGLFLLLGMVTVLIPNKFFARMIPVNSLDYIFLILTAILIGTYLSFNRYKKKHPNKKCTAAAYSGGIGGFLGFGCVLCNKILLLILGAGGVLTYVEPYRPIIGSAGIGLMGYAVYQKGKSIIGK